MPSSCALVGDFVIKSFAGVIQSGTREDTSVWIKLCCLGPGGENLHYYVYRQHAVTGEWRELLDPNYYM